MELQELRALRADFTRLLKADRCAFQKGCRAASNSRGIYVIYKRSGRVAHVGSTPRAKRGIRQRLCNHLANQSSFCTQYLNGDGRKLIDEKYEFSFIVVPSPRRRALLEAYAIGQLCPLHIGHGKPRETIRSSKRRSED